MLSTYKDSCTALCCTEIIGFKTDQTDVRVTMSSTPFSTTGKADLDTVFVYLVKWKIRGIIFDVPKRERAVVTARTGKNRVADFW